MILDTSFLIDLMEGERKAVDKTVRLEEDGIPENTTAVTVFELWSGTERSEIPQVEREKILETLENRSIFDLDKASGEIAGKIDGKLTLKGRSVEPEDAMIAGISIRKGEKVLTGNEKHFKRISEASELEFETY